MFSIGAQTLHCEKAGPVIHFVGIRVAMGVTKLFRGRVLLHSVAHPAVSPCGAILATHSRGSERRQRDGSRRLAQAIMRFATMLVHASGLAAWLNPLSPSVLPLSFYSSSSFLLSAIQSCCARSHSASWHAILYLYHLLLRPQLSLASDTSLHSNLFPRGYLLRATFRNLLLNI
ncbi:hypothetical protein BU23DRAFT_287179 [Bimuria novae-zelandiae CBS 107.79]|uniref:Uncharacterized protein n=1 Tax=Bimuria novae-zelandiae CBS 107.79 TaxID=1447943 RepID=A0A6A5US78_9PLEO|nr:hypothetical protein BU23DRAFT_287179 [Bimuria novae-zelandiae CBS 107.79]